MLDFNTFQVQTESYPGTNPDTVLEYHVFVYQDFLSGDLLERFFEFWVVQIQSPVKNVQH